jgi:hypothetical protein
MFRVQAQAFVAGQWRDPLGCLPVNAERQVEEVPDLFPVGEVDLSDIHVQ